MMTNGRVHFSFGQVLATPGAIEALKKSRQSPGDFLKRHACGDWGEMTDDDRRLNNEAVRNGSRIISVYKTSEGAKLWIITEAADENGSRCATTLLLPDEY